MYYRQYSEIIAFLLSEIVEIFYVEIRMCKLHTILII